MSDISDAGTRLLTFMESLPIETEWIAGHRVVWQTGQQIGPDGAGPEGHTHCSAFAAALALYLDIYLLRPPHHSQQFLANAQVIWLDGGGSYPGPQAEESGWRGLGRASDDGALDDAVAAANAGKLVIAGYIQPKVDGVEKSGHVAVLRPQAAAYDPDKGPQVMMSGTRNWREITMKSAFHSHPQAWPHGIHLSVHDTDLEQSFGAEEGIG